MLDACHSDGAVQMAVDLANTLKPIKGEDALETVEQLQGFLNDHSPPKTLNSGTGREGGLRGRLTHADLAEVRALRKRMRTVLERASVDPEGTAVLINEGLRRIRATPALRHDGNCWRYDVTSGADRCSAHLTAITLGALASVIATLGPERFGVCAGADCRGTFVDLSRNRSKRFCTRTCAHRASVAAHRRRAQSLD